MSNSKVSFVNCYGGNNQAEEGGFGYLVQVNLLGTLVDFILADSKSKFDGHVARNSGGMIAAILAKFMIRDTTILGSSAFEGAGGAIAITKGEVKVIDSTLSGMVSVDHGGSFYGIQATIDIVDSSIENSSSSNSNGGVVRRRFATGVEHIGLSLTAHSFFFFS